MIVRHVRRYEMHTVLFHWVHAALFLILILTGFVMFLTTGVHGEGMALSVIHRIAAVLFVALSVAQAVINPRKALIFMKETLLWGWGDLKWLLAAPDYYFGGSGNSMPPQGHINTGQKLWQLVIILTVSVLMATGTIMWFFRSSIELATYEWVLVVHGIAFVTLFAMFLVHIYMGLLHPAMKESLRSMLDGKISEDYAESHYLKWYKNYSGEKTEEIKG